MIAQQDNCLSSCFLYTMMEQCSRQCIRRTFYAVMVGVLPVMICLVFIGLARLILHRLEIAYHRRQKPSDRRLSIPLTQSGRLALSYTPMSNAELQRIIQGEYQSQEAHESSSTFPTLHNGSIRRAPRFIKSILTRRDPPASSANILANLVVRRDAIDASTMPGAIAPYEAPLQPTFTIVNEQDKRRRPSVITITRESVETTTLAPMNNSSRNSPTTHELVKTERISTEPLMAATKTMTTTTTVVVEEFLDYPPQSSIPYTFSLLDTVGENDSEVYSETYQEEKEEDDDEES